MCVLQIGQSTNRRNCRWTRRLGSGSLIGPPVTDSRVVAGTISPGLNLVMGWPPLKSGLYDPEKSWSRSLPPRRIDTRSPANWLASDRLNLVPVGVSTAVGVSAARWGREAEDGGVQGELLSRARSGDDVAFEELVRPYHQELQAHCYRILGSATDAEDAFQESLTAAWKGLAGSEGRASLRPGLYRLATSRCLNMVRASRRSLVSATLMDTEPPEPSRLSEVLWLEPYPDALLAEVADPTAGPEARYEQRESISLAFITALQLLPPRQRAALILTDVLDFSAPEAANMLDTTEHAIY